MRRKVWAATALMIVLGALAAAVYWSVFARHDFDGEKAVNVAGLREEAVRLASSGRTVEALDSLQKAKRSNPRDVETYVLAAEILGRLGRHREAREEAALAHRLEPNSAQVALDLLHRTPSSFPPAEAEALARKVVARTPESAEARHLLGVAIMNAGERKRFGEALTELKEANRLDPYAASTLIEMGRLYAQMRDLERGDAMLSHAIRLLTREAQTGLLSLAEIEGHLKDRRSAFFWLAQVKRLAGKLKESRPLSLEASKWSERAMEVKTLKDRASMSPPDTRAVSRLQDIAARGLSAWEP